MIRQSFFDYNAFTRDAGLTKKATHTGVWGDMPNCHQYWAYHPAKALLSLLRFSLSIFQNNLVTILLIAISCFVVIIKSFHGIIIAREETLLQ
jgi:hypothetical protein